MRAERGTGRMRISINSQEIELVAVPEQTTTCSGMTDLLNTLSCLLTISFGLFGFLAPRYTASALDLAPTKSTMGLSEMRASVGGLFVVAGMAALWINEPIAYAMLGFAFAGAAAGRVLSLIFDKPPVTKVLVFGGIEAALSLCLLAANL